MAARDRDTDDGEEDRLVRELHVLSAPPICLEPDELREALRLARRLGRTASESEERPVGVSYYRRLVVETAGAAKLLTSGAIDYWASSAALADGRVVALTAGWREGRRGA